MKDLIQKEIEGLVQALGSGWSGSLEDLYQDLYASQTHFQTASQLEAFISRIGRSQMEALVFAYQMDFSCQSPAINKEYLAESLVDLVGDLLIRQVCQDYSLDPDQVFEGQEAKDLSVRIREDGEGLARRLESKLVNFENQL